MTALPDEANSAVAPFYEFLMQPMPLVVESEPEAACEEASPKASDRLFAAVEHLHHLREEFDQRLVDELVRLVLQPILKLCPADADARELRSRLQTLGLDAPALECAPRSNVRDFSRKVPAIDLGADRELRLIRAHVERKETVGTQEGLVAVARIIALTASVASSSKHLAQLLQKHVPEHLNSLAATVFDTLSRALPSWDFSQEISSEISWSVGAMRRIIGLAADANERARSCRELMMSSVDRIIDGRLSIGCAMLELTAEVMQDEAIHGSIAERIIVDSTRRLEEGVCLDVLSDPDLQPLLQRAFNHFPHIGIDPLLDRLKEDQEEPARELLRALLGAWGAAARRTVLVRLDAEIRESMPRQEYVHDLVDLLERIPRGEDEDLRFELDVLRRGTSPGQPLRMVARSMKAIGSVASPLAEQIVARRLSELEGLPFRTDRTFYEAGEIHMLLDVTIETLARIGTPPAIKAILRHCLSQSPKLGDTRSRLQHLAELDLSIDPDSVDLLARTIRAELPVKILGGVVSNRQSALILIQSLRGTRGETVRALLRQVALDFSQMDIGHEASRILQDWTREANGSHENRSGPLTLSALPRLIRGTAATGATGLLSLVDANHEVCGRLWFREGSLLDVENGSLENEAALYQLIERPVASTFAFTARSLPASIRRAAPLDLNALLEEGMRRCTELQLLLAVVPDVAAFKPTGVKPRPDEIESDAQLLRRAWVQASAGVKISDWEADMETDSWRVRRLVARWAEEGALDTLAST
ncbi:MAG TPA: DUF4388 domain-containing protein [Thermoanaerobaculia bacterium]